MSLSVGNLLFAHLRAFIRGFMKKQERRKSQTCIAAIKNRKGKIIMAGDRQVSWGWGFKQDCPEPKVIKHSGFLLGGTGDSDFLELILDGFMFEQEGDLKIYLLFKFKRELSKFLKQQGYRDEHDILRFPSSLECEIMIGKEGKLFIITFTPGDNKDVVVEPSIISIGQVNLPFALGCGASTALPILLSKKKELGYSTKEHLELAMKTAAEISPGCDDKIDFIVED